MDCQRVQLIGAKAASPAGTAHNVRRNKPRVSEGCGLRCARGKRRPERKSTT